MEIVDDLPDEGRLLDPSATPLPASTGDVTLLIIPTGYLHISD